MNGKHLKLAKLEASSEYLLKVEAISQSIEGTRCCSLLYLPIRVVAMPHNEIQDLFVIIIWVSYTPKVDTIHSRYTNPAALTY